jgi:catechol 2,3-dioxygenase-like lactoylglutathione lyase family enzyme
VGVLRSYPCLCVDDIERSVAFYRGLLELEVSADVGWYVELSPPGSPALLVSLVERGHESVPAGFDTARGGVLVSVVVEQVDAVAERAARAGWCIAQSLRDEEFGQRHVMVVDPDGFLVDVIRPIRPSLAFRRALAAGRRRRRTEGYGTRT